MQKPLIHPVLLIAVISIAASGIASLSRERTPSQPIKASVPAKRLPAIWNNTIDRSEFDRLLNDEGRQFLLWCFENGFCGVVPDTDGVIRELHLDICWIPTDEQIQVISRLTGLERLCFRGRDVTNTSLNALADNPSIKQIQVLETNPYSEKAIARVRKVRPDLTLSVSPR